VAIAEPQDRRENRGDDQQQRDRNADLQAVPDTKRDNADGFAVRQRLRGHHAASVSMACSTALSGGRVALISRTLMKKALDAV
jgi:hypothetical protein